MAQLKCRFSSQFCIRRNINLVTSSITSDRRAKVLSELFGSIVDGRQVFVVLIQNRLIFRRQVTNKTGNVSSGIQKRFLRYSIYEKMLPVLRTSICNVGGVLGMGNGSLVWKQFIIDRRFNSTFSFHVMINDLRNICAVQVLSLIKILNTKFISVWTNNKKVCAIHNKINKWMDWSLRYRFH